MEKSRKLKNGMSLYSYTNPSQHGFFISLFIKSGNMHELETEAGITHFFEHAAIRNVNKLYSYKLYSELDKLGLEFNASTFSEAIQFYVSGAKEHTVAGAEYLRKILEPFFLTKSDIDSERMRIKAEIRECDDKSSLSGFAQSKVYSGTPLMNSILGKNSTLDKITLKSLADYRRRILHPDNVFIYVTGNVDEIDLDRISGIFSDAELFSDGERYPAEAILPQDFFKRENAIHIKRADYTMARFSFDVDLSHSSVECLDLIYDILLGGYNSKLFVELSEKRGLFYDTFGGVDHFLNIGSFYFSFEVAGNKLYEAVEVALGLIADLKRDLLSPDECMRAGFVDNAMMLYDDKSELNFTFAYDNHILNRGYKTIEERRALYASLAPEAIREAAREIFIRENLTLAIKGNPKKIDTQKLAEIVSKTL